MASSIARPCRKERGPEGSPGRAANDRAQVRSQGGARTTGNFTGRRFSPLRPPPFCRATRPRARFLTFIKGISPLMAAFILGDALNVMTRRASIGTGAPVRGLRPARSRFVRTMNEPKSCSLSDSPDARVAAISSITRSVRRLASRRDMPSSRRWIASAMSSRVSVPRAPSSCDADSCSTSSPLARATKGFSISFGFAIDISALIPSFGPEAGFAFPLGRRIARNLRRNLIAQQCGRSHCRMTLFSMRISGIDKKPPHVPI